MRSSEASNTNLKLSKAERLNAAIAAYKAAKDAGLVRRVSAQPA